MMRRDLKKSKKKEQQLSRLWDGLVLYLYYLHLDFPT